MKRVLFVVLLSLPPLTGCSTLLSGGNQQLAINTTPVGAACDILRNGDVIASVPSTPAEVSVEKTKDDLTLVCRKDGYLDTQAQLVSGVDPTAYANIFLGGYGLLTWGLDSALGTDNHYPEASSLTLGVRSTATTEAKEKVHSM